MITCRLITETVAEAYGVTVTDMHSRRTHVDIVRPRHMAWSLARELTTKSLPEIARLMGGFDHTSVLAGVRNIKAAIEADPETKKSFETLAEAITILGQACDGSPPLSRQFPDIDPLDVADRVLNAPLRTIMPTLDELRMLAMGVRHYADEARQSQAVVSLGSIRQSALEAAASAVVTAQRALHASAFTNGERAARQRRDDAITKLANLLERT